MSSSSTAWSEESVVRAILESAEVKTELAKRQGSLIVQVAELLVGTFRHGGKVVFFGNGGSAADAQHVAGELVGRFLMKREALPAIALTTDTSILTSIGNDVSFDDVFARQVHALVQPGDVAVGISTSGTSINVLNGLIAARQRRGTTVGFTGRSGGKLRDVADHVLCVPSDSTPRIQEAHITAWHAICEVVERELFGHDA
jgi:D-sedoheptulose 7-phosphate isomerase